MTKRIRIGVLGCANIAKRSVIPALLEIPDFELVAVASRTISKASEFATIFGCEAIEGYDNLIDREDIDALYIPLPTGLHEEFIVKALKKNKHILTEKSLAMNFDSAKKMLEIAKEMQMVLMEDFMFRYHSQHQFVLNQLHDENFGELRLMRAYFGFPPLDKRNFRYNKELGGGAILDAAAYTINVSRWFLGNEIEVNSANLFFDKKSNVCIHGSANLWSSRTGLSSFIGFGFDNYYQCQYELWGSKAILYCDKAFTPSPEFEPTVRVNNSIGNTIHKLPADNHFKNILREFSTCISSKNFDKHQEDLWHQSRLITELEFKAKIQFI